LVDEVLDHRSVALATPHDGIEEPEVLRRVDGTSVYTVAGADLYTSQRILDAETRLVTTAGRHNGFAVEDTTVDLALLEMGANGSVLDAGQASLVRQMCTSGARLQLGIAPAGAGKTTATRALALAWTQDGGHLLGLAPSAAAAAVLGEQTGIRTDTLAKLTWSLDHGELPDWTASIGPSALVIIDEADMTDSLSLDSAVQFAIGRGASVRLVGDDQQLGAIGAGGVLRDIQQSHGSLRLTELHRFTDPAEATASLALRDGKPEALDFYLEHGRVHVGDIATIIHDAFAAWVSDRAAGVDAIMLAPTRKLVNELNRQARDHLLGSRPVGRKVRLADGNQASVGDVIITRSNDRRLRLSPTDRVKNGDRWTITGVGRRGDLVVRHNRSHRTVRLPADYVQALTGLGYATTIHASQGVLVSTHSSTSMKPHWGEISAPLKTWPLSSTGASQNPHSLPQDRYPGFPAYRQRFMIITFGPSIWRSDHNSLSTSQVRSETAPAIAANSRYGLRRAAIRPPSLVRSPCGEPPSASTPKTADQPEQDSHKRHPPSGNKTSTEQLPGAAALAQMWRNARLLDPFVIASAKIDIACLQRALFDGVAGPGLAGKRRHQPTDWVKPQEGLDVRIRPPAAQQGLRASDNFHRNRTVVIHRLRQHGRSVGSLRDCRHWPHTNTAGLTRSEMGRQDKTEDKHERSSREGSSSLLGSGGDGSPQLGQDADL
jgi:AAA domain